MLYREIIAVCSEIHTKHINTLCGQNVELLNVKLAVHIVTTGCKEVKSILFTITPPPQPQTALSAYRSVSVCSSYLTNLSVNVRSLLCKFSFQVLSTSRTFISLPIDSSHSHSVRRKGQTHNLTRQPVLTVIKPPRTQLYMAWI